MKIALIGPFPPYRGGISMFNHSLSKEFEKNHTVFRISFSMMYPKILFPGKSQFSDFNASATDKIINSLNPFSWIKTVKRLNTLMPDIIIFQYWHPFFSPAFQFISKRIKLVSKAKIIANCNNVFPHEKFLMSKRLALMFFKNVDHFIVMSTSVKKDLYKIHPLANCIELKHPVYNIFGKKISKDIARSKLSLKSEKIILFFGMIRNYKGLDILIRSANDLKKKLNDFKIVVAGECYENKKFYYNLAKDLDVESKIRFDFKFIPNHDVGKYFCAADLVVLPYKSATQSGIIPIAYHFNKPVVSTNVGGLSECVDVGKTGFICEPDSKSISKAVVKFFNSKTNFNDHINGVKKHYSWKFFVDKIISTVL